MPKVKDFYQRIEIIDECFRQKSKKWSIESLLECVNNKLNNRYEETISKRTLQYALDYLINEKGAPIEKNRLGAKVYYYYTDANYSIKNLPLSDEEIVLLKDAVELIKEISNTAMEQDIVAVVQKLENTIEKNPTSTHPIIQFERHSISKGMEHFDDLFTAIKEKITLRIVYQPFSKEPYTQLVHPYLLKEYRNRWFLIARDQQLNSICNLALDRIKTIKPSKEDFIENDLFDPVTYFNYLVGVTMPAGEKACEILIKVNANQGPYVKTKPIHFSQEVERILEDGSIVIKLKLIINYEIKSILLSYGADIEVLQPQILRDQMANIFKLGSLMYT